MTEWISKASVMRIIDSSPVYTDVLNSKTYMAEQIENLPVRKEEERPHGEWVLDKEFSFVFNIYECSKCRFNGSKRWHFCPNCGASMRKEGDENEI